MRWGVGLERTGDVGGFFRNVGGKDREDTESGVQVGIRSHKPAQRRGSLLGQGRSSRDYVCTGHDLGPRLRELCLQVFPDFAFSPLHS